MCGLVGIRTDRTGQTTPTVVTELSAMKDPVGPLIRHETVEHVNERWEHHKVVVMAGLLLAHQS